MDQSYKYIFKDDFSASEGHLPEQWLESYGTKSWTVLSEDEQTFLSQENSLSDSLQVFLHAFERNPYFSADFRLAKHKEEGFFSFLVRYNAEGAWVRVEYDTKDQMFKLIEQEDIGRKPILLDSAYSKLSDGWHSFAIKADSSAISFELDGKQLLYTSKARHCTYGKVGFETYNAVLQIDNVTYKGNYGRPNKGVVQGGLRIPMTDSVRNENGRLFYGLHLGVLPQRGDSLLGIVGFRDHSARGYYTAPFAIIRSSNAGMNWTQTALDEREWLKDSDSSYIRGFWPDFVLNKNEWILMGHQGETLKNTAYKSTDLGENWKSIGSLNIPDTLRTIHTGHPWQLDKMTMPGKLSSNEMGIFYPTTRVLWQSKSNGGDWQPITVFHPENTTWNPRSQEHQIIQLNDTLVMYSRDDGARENMPESNTLVKRISLDSGKTWSNYEINNTPFVSSKCAFGIKKDPYSDAIWMFWTYNNKADEPDANNQPRTRLGLAVSYNNTKTWQYVMDVDEWGYPSRDSLAIAKNLPAYLTKDNRYANLSLWLSEKYIYLTARRRFRHGSNNIEDFCILYTRVEKSKTIAYPEFPGTHY